MTRHGQKCSSDSAIAKHCKVTQPFVSKTRREINEIQKDNISKDTKTVLETPLKPAPILETENEERIKYWRNKVRNLESRIAKLETKHSDPVIEAFHELACKLAREQELPEPDKPRDLSMALMQLADYLPD